MAGIEDMFAEMIAHPENMVEIGAKYGVTYFFDYLPASNCLAMIFSSRLGLRPIWCPEQTCYTKT